MSEKKCIAPALRVLVPMLLAAPLAAHLTACGGDSRGDEAAVAEPASDSEPAASVAGTVGTGATESSWEGLLLNARRPEEGVLSGGQPSLEQLEAASAAGFRTVINLRGEDEPGTKAAASEALAMTYVALPIDGNDALTEENARRFADVLASAERPAIVHCGSGNRVGALFALKAYFVDGKSAEHAFEIGEAAGMTGSARTVRQRLEEDAEAAGDGER